MNLLPGTYGCVPSSGAVGWIIEHGTASPYGHAFIVVGDGQVMEARPSSAGLADLGKYVRAGAVFNDTEPFHDDFRRQVVEWAMGHTGAVYDWWAILDLAGRTLGRKSPLLPVGRHDMYICSQFVSVGYTACGKVMYPDLDRWTVSPRVLADRITTRAWA